jgi:3-hydroxyacyl-[acyl-carrier-protein] dehydratase
MSNLYSFHNLQSIAGAFRAEVGFDASHPVFAGHFPGQPIVPGVILVEILTSVVAEVTGKQVIIKEASVIKFLQVIDPLAHPTVVLEGTINEDDAGNFKADATFRQGELLFAKMKGLILAVHKEKIQNP